MQSWKKYIHKYMNMFLVFKVLSLQKLYSRIHDYFLLFKMIFILILGKAENSKYELKT